MSSAKALTVMSLYSVTEYSSFKVIIGASLTDGSVTGGITSTCFTSVLSSPPPPQALKVSNKKQVIINLIQVDTR